jgi:hypothetical protein
MIKVLDKAEFSEIEWLTEFEEKEKKGGPWLFLYFRFREIRPKQNPIATFIVCGKCKTDNLTYGSTGNTS